MRRPSAAFLLVLLGVLLSIPLVVLAGDDVPVNGYFRSDGTYVQPHMRSAPDSSFNNNWSTSPNVNPYTGKEGTRQPRLYDNNTSGGSTWGGGGGSQWGTGSGSRSRSRW
jgi:hypothetical protein